MPFPLWKDIEEYAEGLVRTGRLLKARSARDKQLALRQLVISGSDNMQSAFPGRYQPVQSGEELNFVWIWLPTAETAAADF